MATDPIFGKNPNPVKADTSRQSPPTPGSYKSGSAEQAANRAEAWPESNSPGPDGHSNKITSRQPGPRGPFQSDSSSWPEWLKKGR